MALNLTLGNNVLNPAEIKLIRNAASKILEKTGIEVENKEILEKLAEFGGTVNNSNNRVTFKQDFTEGFIRDSSKINWENRKLSFSAAAEIYQGYFLDPIDDRYKEWTEQRLIDYINLAKTLPDIDGVGMLGCPLKETPASLQPLYEKLYAWKYGLMGGSAIWDTSLCPKIYEMWEVYASETDKKLSDIFRGTVYLISPLKFGRAESEQFIWFYKKGLSTSVGTLGSLGGTAPVTLAGALALQIAETLFINILERAFFGSKALKMGTSISVIDMSSGAFQYGRPEQAILNIAGAQIARDMGAQYGGHGGLTDAKVPGHEAGVQKACSALLNATSFGYGHIAAGLLGVDEIFSPVQMILDDEVTGAMKRLFKGFEVNDETLGLDIINEVGPGGTFLDTSHTAAHFRHSLWQPSVWSREMYSVWKNRGNKNDIDRAKEKYLSCVNRGKELKPLISERTEKRLLQIIEK